MSIESADDKSQPPSTDWGAIQTMGLVIEKLKLLDYESQCCRSVSSSATDKGKDLATNRLFRPVDVLYFALAASADQVVHQWQTLVALVSWLLVDITGEKKLLHLLQKYTSSEEEDQGRLLLRLQAHWAKQLTVMVKWKMPVHDIEALKQNAHGEIICNLLNDLCDLAIKKKGIVLQRPDYHKAVITLPARSEERQMQSSETDSLSRHVAEAKIYPVVIERNGLDIDVKQHEQTQGQLHEAQQDLHATQGILQEKIKRVEKLKEKFNTITARLDAANEKLQLHEGNITVPEFLTGAASLTTDSAPLVKVKTVLDTLKTEIHKFDVRIRVVEHILLRARMSNERELQKGIMGRTNVINFLQPDGTSIFDDDYDDGGEEKRYVD